MKYNIDDIQDYTISEQPKISFSYTPISLPVYVGGYRLGEDGAYYQVNFTKKPCWFHRKMVKLILGWNWVDTDGKV